MGVVPSPDVACDWAHCCVLAEMVAEVQLDEANATMRWEDVVGFAKVRGAPLHSWCGST